MQKKGEKFFFKVYFLMNVFDGCCCANNHIGKSFRAFIIFGKSIYIPFFLLPAS